MALSQLQHILGPEPKKWSETKRRIACDAVLYALLEPTKISGWLEVALANAYRETKNAEERSDGANDFLKRYKGTGRNSISKEIQLAFGRIDSKPFEFPPKRGKGRLKDKKAQEKKYLDGEIYKTDSESLQKGDTSRIKNKKTREQAHVIRDIYTVAEVVKQIRRLIESPVGSNKPSVNKAKLLIYVAKATARHRYSDPSRISSVWARMSSVAHLAAAFAELFPEGETDEISQESLSKLRRKIRAFLCYANQFRVILTENRKFGGNPIVRSLLPVPDFKSEKYKLSPVGHPFTQKEKDCIGTGKRERF